MEGRDEWLAVDKAEHLLACFLVALSLSFLLSRSGHSFLRRWALPLASTASLAAGAVKEAADQAGLWGSAGASIKDAVADAAGVILAAPFAICIRRRPIASRTPAVADRALSMV